MRLKSNIKMTGSLIIKKYDQDNKLVEQHEVDNLVVTTGKQYVASRMASDSTDIMSHMAIGSNSTTASVGNTQLISQLGITDLDSTIVTGTVITYTATFGPGVGTGSIVEAGIFNADETDEPYEPGIMLCRTTFPVIVKEAGTTISITWNVSVG
jgi:hypothetical protein